MKKYVLLTLLVLGSAQTGAQAAVVSDQLNDVVKNKKSMASPSQTTTEESSSSLTDKRLASAIDFFEAEKNKSKSLKALARIFDFPAFSEGVLNSNANAGNYYIVSEFIRGGAEGIIKSNKYRSSDDLLFILVENLDPVCRYYMGAAEREAMASDL